LLPGTDLALHNELALFKPSPITQRLTIGAERGGFSVIGYAALEDRWNKS
jgi:hypothetical protein